MKARHWTSQITAFAHHKLDGINLRVSFNEKTSTLSALTRTPHDIGEKLKHCGWVKPLVQLMPSAVTVHGELYVPGRKASQVTHMIAHDPSQLRFAGFAIEGHLDYDAPLDLVNVTLSKWGIATVPYAVHESLKLEGYGGLERFTHPKELLDRIPDGCEGWVLKNGNLQDWYKLKPKRTIDCICKGYADGSGKYLGLIGSVIVETIEGVEIARVSGMDYPTRVSISEDEQGHIGKVCEVSYQYIGDRGRLRHPAFLRWRDDKPTCECTLEQDPELKEYWDGKDG